MNYIKLNGANVQSDITTIKSNIDRNVFVFIGHETIYDYIEKLNSSNYADQRLSNEELYKFKVCYEKTGLDITLIIAHKSDIKISCMSDLINLLDIEKTCRIIINNDSRTDFAFVVQQLIYIGYPLSTVDILLRKDEKDADKTKRFMENVNQLHNDCLSAISKLEDLYVKVCSSQDDSTKADRISDIEKASSICKAIETQIKKSMDVELKIAVAASKKTGKSVIVNSFIGKQLAPTSLELATPNTCIYKRSTDDKYHLHFSGNDYTFDNALQIYDSIGKQFEQAQNNSAEGFALPDMKIEYVTNANNFSSYTIFDTAGPDAAGTTHKEKAIEAMNKCDVAVFAIDYSKYLTSSEEEYLREIKTMFSQKNKFHSLVFALNKMDCRYTDTKTNKSVIKSVDFIRTRLKSLAPEYEECIIFPTSALEYFNAVEAENSGITELKSENNLKISNMRRVALEHKDVEVLSWLRGHADNLEYYYGFENISYDIFKSDSGMPALMNYVSYVAHSKARDEIVNNITFNIDTQINALRSIQDYISNLESIINENDNKIKEISAVINDYSENAQSILSTDISREELPEGSILLNHGFNCNVNNAIKHETTALKDTCDREYIAEMFYDETIHTLWEKTKNKSFTGEELNNILNENDFKKIINAIASSISSKLIEHINHTENKISESLKFVIENRQQKLKMLSDECGQKLDKLNCFINMPQMSKFSFEMPKSKKMEPNITISSRKINFFGSLENLLNKSFNAHNVFTFFGKLFNKRTNKDYKYTFDANGYMDFKNKYGSKLKSDIENMSYSSNIDNQCIKSIKNIIIDKYLKNLLDKINEAFDNMNHAYRASVNTFVSVVDDRDKYKGDMEALKKRKENIKSICDSTKVFVDHWNDVLNDVQKINYERKVAVTV